MGPLVLTCDAEVNIADYLGVWVHLALVGTWVSGLTVLHLKRPVICLLAVDHLREGGWEKTRVIMQLYVLGSYLVFMNAVIYLSVYHNYVFLIRVVITVVSAI